jgi:hypothetical protein
MNDMNYGDGRKIKAANRSGGAFLALILLVPLILSACGGGGGASSGESGGGSWDATPVVLTPEAPNTQVLQNEKAILDYSNASKGYICAKSLIGPTVVKLLVQYEGTQYQYTLPGSGEYVVIPLSCGDGVYNVGLWENLYDDQFAAIFAQELQVQLENPFLPFLYPNQFVNFSAGDQTVAMSQELATGASGEIQAIGNIYEYIIENIDYDFEKAATVSANYLPVIDETLSTKKGICFDYAVLTAAMLRAQRIPTRLMVGYAGSAYHSWIEVYSEETGWVRKKIQFNGNAWVLMDPTFASANDGRNDISAIVGDGSNYNPRFMY